MLFAVAHSLPVLICVPVMRCVCNESKQSQFLLRERAKRLKEWKRKDFVSTPAQVLMCAPSLARVIFVLPSQDSDFGRWDIAFCSPGSEKEGFSTCGEESAIYDLPHY